MSRDCVSYFLGINYFRSGVKLNPLEQRSTVSATDDVSITWSISEMTFSSGKLKCAFLK